MVSFKIFAGTDVGLRDNNEDNFTICPNLAHNEWVMPADHQQVILLGECGCLLVVADGMGGQNAGEVASAIAIETVQTMFAPDCLTDKVLSKPSSIKEYLKKVISKADINVKEYSESHPEAEGLGSTIVMAWVIGNKAYVAWLGDSRAYAYVPNQGIKRLSKDHSYVQQLVDAGKITDVEAMNHPNSNVITRSLGDMSQKAKADVEEHTLEDGEIILLCSDGLCGVCTDEEIASVLSEESADLQVCKAQLTELALDNGGSDNITIAFMEISCKIGLNEEKQKSNQKHRNRVLVALGILLMLAFAGGAFLKTSHHKMQEQNEKIGSDSTESSIAETNRFGHQNDSILKNKQNTDSVKFKQDKRRGNDVSKGDTIGKKIKMRIGKPVLPADTLTISSGKGARNSQATGNNM